MRTTAERLLEYRKKTLDAVGHKGKRMEVRSLKELGIDGQEFRDWLIDIVENAYKQQG